MYEGGFCQNSQGRLFMVWPINTSRDGDWGVEIECLDMYLRVGWLIGISSRPRFLTMHEHFLELVWSDHLVGNGGAVSQDNQRHAVEARYLPNYPLRLNK